MIDALESEHNASFSKESNRRFKEKHYPRKMVGDKRSERKAKMREAIDKLGLSWAKLSPTKI